jgi:tetraacyldisaccharide 4'-kinase
MQWLINFWYKPLTPLSSLLWPLHFILFLLVSLRKYLYILNIFKSTKIDVPVIIVGNITVGGTGKSPLVIHLAESLTAAGYKVGVLSRGYGGKAKQYPLEVKKTSVTLEVGDEPYMIKQRVDVSVVVDPIRSRGAKYLVEHCACDVIVCDDGLQHYALQRDIEIVVIDGNRKLGNRLLMPLGPLRESVKRLKNIDAVVLTTSDMISKIEKAEFNTHFTMTLLSQQFVSVKDNNKALSLEQFNDYCLTNNTNTNTNNDNLIVDSVAGIGNPKRFFKQLNDLGIQCREHQFIDHHKFVEPDFKNMNSIIIMTEKDAVKCRQFATDVMWYLKVEAEITPSIVEYCLDRINPPAKNKRD